MDVVVIRQPAQIVVSRESHKLNSKRVEEIGFDNAC
jgi:hypothetical protein